MPYERLVVVGNPNSTRAGEIRRDVFGRLAAERIGHRPIQTRDSSVESLAEQLEFVERDDRLLIAGGDGMLALAVNALRLVGRVGQESPQLGFMAYGNRCDGAAVSGRVKRDVMLMQSEAMQPQDYRPLRVSVHSDAVADDLDWLAVSYVSVGDLSVGGAEHFSSPSVRAKLIGKRALYLHSAHEMLRYYRQQRRQLNELAGAMTIDQQPVPFGATDVVLLNGQKMASTVINSQAHYLGGQHRRGLIDAKRYGAVVKAYLSMQYQRGMPGVDVASTSIALTDGTFNKLQSDGEVHLLPPSSTIRVDKSAADRLTVLTHS